jgi:hypothetical protein
VPYHQHEHKSRRACANNDQIPPVVDMLSVTANIVDKLNHVIDIVNYDFGTVISDLAPLGITTGRNADAMELGAALEIAHRQSRLDD